MKRKSMGLNAALNGIRSVLNILFPIITFPYVSRILQVKGIGIYNFSNSVVSYFLLIAALGVSNYAVREGARIRDNKKEISQFSSEVFTINIFSTLFSYILLFICLFAFTRLHNYIPCIAIFSLQIFFTTIGTEWIYQIYEDYTYITVRSILFQLISLVLLFVFVRHANDYLNYAAITVFSSVGANFLNFIHARKYCHIQLKWNFNWRVKLKPILILFGVNIASMIYVNSDITLLGLMKNDYIVGIYSVSSKVYQIVKTLIAAILVVTVPRLAMLFGKKRIKEYKEILSRLTNILVLLALPASVGLFMLAKEVILIISGDKFLPASNSLRILCFAYIFSILGWILTECVLIPAKREKFVLRSTTISAILNIVLNLLLIPSLNENAAAISTILAECCIFIVNYHYAKDLVKDVFLSRKLLKTFITSIIGCLGIIIICIICNIIFSSIIMKTIFSIWFSVILYFLILALFRNEFVIEIIKSFREKIKINK